MVQKPKIMACSPITSWQIDGDKVETVEKLPSWAKKSLQRWRHLLLGKKAMTNLDSVLKGKDMTLPSKSCTVKAMVFPVVMYRCESGTIKKAKHQKIDAFKLCCWRRLLRVPWTVSKSKLSNLKEINPEYSLEGLTQLQYFGHLRRRANSQLTGNDSNSGKYWRQKEKGTAEDETAGWHHWLNRHEFEQTPGDSEGQRSLACCSAWGCRVRHDLAAEQQWHHSVLQRLESSSTKF